MNIASLIDSKLEPKKATKAQAGKPHVVTLARDLMERQRFLSTTDGYLYVYTGTHWEWIKEGYIKALALRADGEFDTTQARRNEIADYIKCYNVVPKIPWRRLALNEIPFENGVLNVDTDEIRPHRSEDYLESIIPHEYVAGAECPAWLDALDLYFGQDSDAAEKISAMQQFFGYCLLPHARFKKAMVLHGESDTGKSQPLYILREIIGAGNCCAVSVECMDDPRKRVPLMGKSLNVLTELTSRSVVADGGFKTLISTEEPLQFDPKYESPIMYTPYAKHVIACNELPTINDRSKATYNRLLLIQFNRVIPESLRDRNIMDRLRAELPGIIAWAVRGAAWLINSGGEFCTIASADESIAQYRHEQNEVAMFIDEKCEVGEDYAIPMSDFREKFLSWAQRHHSTRQIGVLVKNAGFNVEPTYINGKTVRALVGARLL